MWTILGARRIPGPKPTEEHNRCELKPGTPGMRGADQRTVTTVQACQAIWSIVSNIAHLRHRNSRHSTLAGVAFAAERRDGGQLSLAAPSSIRRISGLTPAWSIGFSYWKGRKDQEVDIIVSVEGRLVPFEVIYRALTKPKPIADAELTALGWTVKDLQVPKLFQ
jgi:hypothetical protein